MNYKIYYLQTIQGVINRLAGNSFLIKGWSITVVAAMIALLARGSEKRYILFALVPTVMFWFLDAIYLCNERRYKALYEIARLLPEDKVDFVMDTSQFKKKAKWIRALFSHTLVLFYSSLVLTVIIIYLWL